MKTVSLALIAALVASSAAQAQAVPQTGAVVAGGVTTTPLPTTTFVQSCNAGLGGIVGQGACAFPVSGGGGGGGGGAVTIADGADVALGAQADALYNGSGAGSLIAISKSIRSLLVGTLTVTGAVTVGSAATPITQGVATAGTNSLNVYVGGSVTQSVQGAVTAGTAFGSATPPVPIAGCTTVAAGVCSAGTVNQVAVSAVGALTVGGTTAVANAAANIFPQGTTLSSSQALATWSQNGIYNSGGNVWGSWRDVASVVGATAAQGAPAVGALGFAGYTESTTALGVSPASFTSTGRAAPSWVSYFQCKGYADQAGTITIQQSDDSGTSYYPLTAAVVIAASGAAAFARVNITGAVATTLFRCVEVNTSATAQTINRLTTAFSAN